jgi:predicted secreted hydrolase
MRTLTLLAAALLALPLSLRERAGVRGVTEPPLRFPRDHGAHPAATVEWWYYTGHLRGHAKREYGFQLTFFRVHELHLAHFAWTDSARGSFEYDEKMHLSLPGIASAAEGRLEVLNEDWSAREKEGIHRLSVSGKAGKLELTLRAVKPPVLHGENGVSRKGPGAEEFSRYVSITRLEASGMLSRGKRAERLSGVAWFDHEWGSGVLPAGGTGWDWFALHLDDGSELMLYRLRDKLGGATPFSSGTFVPKSGLPIPIPWSDVRMTETGKWKSPRTGAVYPSGWRIAVSSARLDVALDPLLRDQELVTEESTGVTYWEGACRVRGTRQGRPVTGRAYAELTGYAGRDLPGLARLPPFYSFSVRLATFRSFDRPTSLVSSVRRNVLASRRFR